MRYHLREGFHSIFTHGLMSFAAVCMIVACLVIMGSFSLVAVDLDRTLGDLESENEFIAYIDDSLTTEQAKAVQKNIERIPNVASAEFVDKVQALADYKARYSDTENAALFEGLPDDTLRDRYEIRVTDIEQMARTVEQVRQVSGVADVSAAIDVAQGFVTVRNMAGAVAWVLIILLLVISLFIIANTTKLATFHRREEIAIMKMCGATNWFVRWPFVFEGMILGLIGAVVAFFLQWGIYSLITQAVNHYSHIRLVSILPYQTLALPVSCVYLGIGLLVGVCGSLITIRKFLRV